MYKNRKGIQFSKRDTWSLDNVLDPILYSALTKFKEVILSTGHGKCPSQLFEETGDWDKDVERGEIKFLAILDKMIYAFDSSNKPNILEYDFGYEPAEGHGEVDSRGLTKWAMRCTNEEESTRYREDTESYEAKCTEGRLLFGEYYQCLWN